ncbi:MAG TPA: hypothetical protein VHC49_15085 [Mycobacteriales bacterium]|nr:hypothetical protein [Mycobacteriales bacterium]
MQMADSFSVTQSFQDAFDTLLHFIPRLIGALIILIVGYLIARLIERVVARLLVKLRVNETLANVGVQRVLDRSGTGLTSATLLAKIVFWFVLVIVLTMFAGALGISEISTFMNQMIAYIPNIFAAIVIVFLAMLFGRFLAGIVQGLTQSQALAKATQTIIIVYAVFVALVQLHIARQLTGPTFLIILAGIALAGGLAFGLGGRAEAERYISRIVSSSGRHAHPDDNGPGNNSVQ